MLWMIDLLVKDNPPYSLLLLIIKLFFIKKKDIAGVGYALLVARIWEHFDVAAPCVVFLSVLNYTVDCSVYNSTKCMLFS
jgi:hypothetical protein